MLDIALKNVFRQKARSLLTILGIAMGIGLILTLGAIGEGLNRQIEESFGDMAAVVDVRYRGTDEGITNDMIEDVRDIPGVTDVIAIGEYSITRRRGRGFGGMMSHMMGRGGGSTLQFTALDPDDQDYLIGENIVAAEGRKLDSSDDGQYAVLLGYNSAENQFLNVGDEIEYERRQDTDGDGEDETESFYFDVIGILEETGDSNIDNAAYVSLSTMQELEDDDKITQLKVKIDDLEKVEEITRDISGIDDDVFAYSPLEMVRRLEDTLGTITMAVYGIGLVSIIVGGIGIMNTMVMSVMERRREIGVMKAIGATTKNILMQVLEESAVLSLIGGFAGLLLGYSATVLVNTYTNFVTVLGFELIAIGFLFSLILGMGAGLYPAWAASQLDPIEVLRYE